MGAEAPASLDGEGMSVRAGHDGRRDANQRRIVQALRDVGASVAITAGAGNGLPDLIVGWRGTTHLFEVKDGEKPASQRKLTPAEAYFVEHWRGRPVVIVESVDDALLALGLR